MTKRWMYAATAGVCLVSLVGVVGCQPPDAPPFNPRASQELERSLARQIDQEPMVPIPTALESEFEAPVRAPDGTLIRKSRGSTRPIGPIIKPEFVRRLTLQDVIQRAVVNNLDLRVAGYDPAVEQTRIIEAEARFDPRYFLNFQHQQRDDASAGTEGSRGHIYFFDETWQTQYQTGVRQNLESGGQIEVREELNYNFENPARTVLNPTYTSQLVLELTQPILRDFGNFVNQARITIARTNTRIAVLDFRKALEETLFNLERLYWQQYQTEREVQSVERLLQRTENTADILLKRFGNDVSRIQTSEAAARVEEARSDLVRLRTQLRDISFQIKKLVNDPNIPVSGPEVILAATSPVTDPLHFTLSEQIDAAMEHRFDLGQQLLKIESAGIVVRVAKNNLLPSLNLIGGAGFQGLQGGAGPAFEDAHDFDGFNFKAGFQFEVPIGNREAKAIYKRSSLQRQQAVVAYDALVATAGQEVAQAYNLVNSQWQLMFTTSQARLAAEDHLSAFLDREQRGEPLTPDFVNRKLDAQRDLSNQEREEALAIASYQTAVAGLERAKGTLLRYNNVQMAEEALPFAYKPIPAEPKPMRSKNLPGTMP